MIAIKNLNPRKAPSYDLIQSNTAEAVGNKTGIKYVGNIMVLYIPYVMLNIK
jgi:hypothetical protein